MELIYHVYANEWYTAETNGGPPPDGSPLQKVETFLDRLQDCGFTGVSVGETLDVIDEILARKYVFTETYNTLRDLGDGSRFLDRLRKRPLKIGVRLHGSRVPSQDWFARLGNTPHQSTGRLGTSPYARTAGTTASSAAAVMREFAAATDRAGILDKADWISIGWDFTGEIDDIRGFKPDVVAGSGNQPPYPPVPYQEKLAHLAARAYDAPRLPAPSRKPAPLFRQGGTVGEVQRRLLEAVIRELKASKPIGGQRGSIWHAQEIRRNYPLSPLETATFLADVNQLTVAQCLALGFRSGDAGSGVQRQALAFSCDLLLGTGVDLAVNEFDFQLSNLAQMSPPFVFKDTWSSSTAYSAGDTVTRMLTHDIGEGQQELVKHYYRAETAVSGNPPPEDNAAWADLGDPSSHPPALKEEVFQRALVCFSRGVSFQMLHLTPNRATSGDPLYSSYSALAGAYWGSTVNRIKTAMVSGLWPSARKPLVSAATTVQELVQEWQVLGGAADVSVPIIWRGLG